MRTPIHTPKGANGINTSEAARLMKKKKYAIVPVNSTGWSFSGITSAWTGGPPAWAMKLEKPDRVSKPAPNPRGGGSLRHADAQGHDRQGQRAKASPKNAFADAHQQHGRDGHRVKKNGSVMKGQSISGRPSFSAPA
jgi:hypothetical protein